MKKLYAWLEIRPRARWLVLMALCLGYLALDAAPAVAAAFKPDGPAMRFVVVRGSGPQCDPLCPEWISAEGTILSDSAVKFKKFLKTIGNRKLPVIIQSPGGDVDAALAIGRMIRAKGLAVAVGRTFFTSCSPETKGCKAEKEGGYTGAAYAVGVFCNSACPMILAGGVQRLVGRSAYAGVHQVTSVFVKEQIHYRTKTRVVRGKKVVTKEIISRKRAGTTTTTKMSKALRRKLQGYFTEMGVSTDILQPIEKTPASEILLLKQQELLALKLVTGSEDVQEWTNSDTCYRSAIPAHCRKVASVPHVRIVRSGGGNCAPNCEEWISLEGDIDQTALPLVQDALQKLDGPRPIVLSSHGGDIDSALTLGRFIRQRGLTVSIGRTISTECRPAYKWCDQRAGQYMGFVDTRSPKPYCTSVCPLVLAGGVERIVGETVSVQLDSVASFQHSVIDKKKKQKKGVDSDTVALVTAYLGEMGVDPNVLKQVPTAPGETIRLSPLRMRMLRLATQ